MKNRVFTVALLMALAVPGMVWAGGGGGEGGHHVIGHIALCMVFASLLGLTVKALKQPLILGYLIAGFLIGPSGLIQIWESFPGITENGDIKTIAEIGLILLLFMIGLEIDLKKMKAAGKLVIVTGIFQFPICVALGFAIFTMATKFGLDFGDGRFTLLYVALAISISSTMIVVKLLYEKMELDTLPGRISLGILVFQDIWAIIVLAVQPNLENPEIAGLAKTFGIGALLVVGSLACSKYILPRVFKMVAKTPELLLVLSLGWCFLVCLVAAHPSVGLSMEMGALIAGVALATFPYNLDVIAKVTNIRDFFITLFFVALGMQIPIPEVQILLLAFFIAVTAVAVRLFGIFGILYFLKAGHRTSLLTTINLSQKSEFSLVILALGVTYNHITQDILTTLILSFSILAVASTYLVNYSHPLHRALSKLLKSIGLKDLEHIAGTEDENEKRPLVLLGFYRVASAFFEETRQRSPQLLEQMVVVDFNPEIRQKLSDLNVPVVYGDLSSPDTLHHAKIEHAKVVLCTLPDYILKGTSNLKLMDQLREICPDAQLIMSADSPTQTKALYDKGANYVIQTSAVSGASAVPIAEFALHRSLEEQRETDLQELATRDELLT